MNKIVTSKENLLKTSRNIVKTKGWSSVNIRSVAKESCVSIGTIYNHFPSKSALISDTVESVWCDVFHEPEGGAVFKDIFTCISWMFERMKWGNEEYPDFFNLHSLGFMQVDDKSEGIQKMHETWQHILDGLSLVLKNDPNVRKDAFNEQFTVERFAEMLFSLMLAALIRKDYATDAILEVIRRTIY